MPDPGAVADELPAVELPGLALLDDGVSVSVSVSVLVSGVDEPELIVPGEVLRLVESEREPAPEPAPDPMLPEVVSRGLADGDEEDGDVVERLLLDCELLLSVSRELLFDHFENSDCESDPSLFASAVVNAPLSSACSAASVCEMRPSRFASSVENEAVPAPWLELLEPIVLLLCPEVGVPWLELLLPGVDELLCP